MGAVYRAVDLLHNQLCALKELRLGYLPADDETRLRESDKPLLRNRNKLPPNTQTKAAEQFFLEAKLLAKLDHPNLPKVIDYFSESRDYFLVMNLIEGKDLAEVLEETGGKPLPEELVIGWMNQVMEALRYCHEQGVIHRDVKPANVIVTEAGKAFLVDFGIAKSNITSVKTTIGARATTPGYSPLEQYGQGHTDVRSDIYSLGAMLYALLTGREPMDVTDRLTGEEMPSVWALNQSISTKVDGVVSEALSIRPVDRFQSIVEMQEALIENKNLEDTIVSRFSKTMKETVCVGISEWQGEPRIFIRIFLNTNNDEKPTIEGIALPIDKYDELLNGVKALRDVLGSNKVVAEIQKSSSQKIRIQSKVFNGIPLIDLRTFSYFGKPKDWNPLKKGIALKVEKYPDLLEAVNKLGRLIAER